MTVFFVARSLRRFTRAAMFQETQLDTCAGPEDSGRDETASVPVAAQAAHGIETDG